MLNISKSTTTLGLMVVGLLLFFHTQSLASSDLSGLTINEAKNSSPVAKNYFDMCQFLKAGEIDKASMYSDDPSKFAEMYRSMLSKVGQAKFLENMQMCDQITVHSIYEQDNYALIILNIPNNKFDPVGAKFYKKDDDGYKEIVTDHHNIPCELNRKFYIAKGEPEAEIRGGC